MSRNAYNPDIDDRHEFPKLKAQFDEDPARFLQSGQLLAEARIGGIRDAELIEAYRAVAKQILSGSSQTSILEALADRERELTGDEITPEPTATEPAIADGGTVETPDDSANQSHTVETPAESGESSKASPVPDSASDSFDPLHPDVKGLDAGEVLVLEFPDATEYIFPSTPAADAPYLMRTAADETPTGLSFEKVLARIDGSPDPQPIAEIDVQPPTLAASNGGSDQ